MTDRIINGIPVSNWRKSRWTWMPTLYLTRGLPYVAALLVSLVFFNRMGLSNGTIALNTSWLLIPFILRPWIGRIVSAYQNKRFWILLTEAITAAGLWIIGLAISSRQWFLLTMMGFFLITLSGALHDVAIARFYRTYSSKQPSHEVLGIHTLCYLLAIVVFFGIPVMVAGNLEVLNRRVRDSWTTTFYLLSIAQVALLIYHAIALPHPNDKSTIPLWNGLTRRWWHETKTAFTAQPHHGIALAFLFLYLIPEGMFLRIAPLFLIDPGSNGGLSLSPQELGLVQGSVGAFSLIFGYLAGKWFIARYGRTQCLLPLTAALTLPKILFVYLSYNFVSTLSVINLCVATEQAGLGMGLALYGTFLTSLTQGRYPVFKHSIGMAIAALSLMASGWFTGFLQERMGYRHFFVATATVNILPFAMAYFVRKQNSLAHPTRHTGKERN